MHPIMLVVAIKGDTIIKETNTITGKKQGEILKFQISLQFHFH